MFPINFEWVWDAGHLVFMGGLWFALSIMGLGVTYCIIKAVLDAGKGNGRSTDRTAIAPSIQKVLIIDGSPAILKPGKGPGRLLSCIQVFLFTRELIPVNQ